MKGNIKLKIKKKKNENENEISLSIEHLTIEDSNELQNSNTSETTIVQDSGLKRNTIDKYYTVTQTVDICMKLISEKLNIGSRDLCIEPSAGNGSFITKIKSLFQYYKFYDIQPEHPEITKKDYLTFQLSDIDDDIGDDSNDAASNNNDNMRIHLIGNPPFGRQSSLAIKFIKKSCQFCDTISFILPKSFKKDSLKKHFPLNFHLLLETDLPENSFTINKNFYNVPSVFQIWEKKNIEREAPKKYQPINFHFVKKTENPDISFRRVGINAGVINKKIKDKSEQSHYFIKFNKPITEAKFKKLSQITFQNKNDTVGPRSISKNELIKEFNVII